MTKYAFTKKMCKSMIHHRVCPRCGGKLVPLETEDNAGQPTYWAGCPKCQRFNWGVPRRTFDIAVLLLDKYDFHPCEYTDRNYERGDPEWRAGQLSEIVVVVSYVEQALKVYEETNKNA